MVDRRSGVVNLLCFLFSCLLWVDFSLQQQQQLQQQQRRERLALLELRSSLGLRAKEWPIKKNPCTDWAGVHCSSNGLVTEINISRFKRTRIGALNARFSVDALQNFTLLASFNASGFALPGAIPKWFGQKLSALQVLDLRSCGITGEIPLSIGNLTSLTSLYLANNNLTGSIPSSLGQLSRLLVIDLARNSLIGPVSVDFSGLRNLTWLDMSLNYLSGAIPPGLGTLSMLQVLNLSRNSLSSTIPAQLGDLVNLVDLDLSTNLLTGSLPLDLRGLRTLQRMLLNNNSLSGPLPGDLFQPLARLQSLVVNDNGFTDDLPQVLWSMPQLQYLDASGNNFTGTLPDTGSNDIVNSVVFNVSRNMLFGNLTAVIRRFSFIDLSDNYFQGKVLDYARNNTSLNSNCLQNLLNQRNLTECTSFYAERGLRFDNFGAPNAMQPAPEKSSNKTRNIILVAVLGGVGLIALLLVVVTLLFICIRRRGATSQRGTGVMPAPTGVSPPASGVSLKFSSVGDSFTYEQILQATGDFSDENLMKHGHSGDLFRGILESGIPVVIKKVDSHLVKTEAYMLELDFFGKTSHPRLVPLLGHCLENENEKFLIYKYMPNGDLSSSLFRKINSDNDSLQSLDWITRLKIAIGAAEGLSYLHHECNPPLVHRDVQASSILLDDRFEVRLGSLYEVCVQEGDTHQSRITRLLRMPQTSEQGLSGIPNATCAYDVYCFGKVLLELVTGKMGMSAASDAIFKDWLEVTLPHISIYDKELVTNILDPSLIIDEDLLEEVWAMAIVARSCLNPKPSRRPLMRYILKALENPLKVVREERTSSARLRTTSSRGSWTAALFGSWRQSSSDVTTIPAAHANKLEGGNSFKLSGTSGSLGSGRNVEGGYSSSNRRQSKEIFPEPLDERDVEVINSALQQR